MWSDKRRAVETLRFTLLLEVGAQDWELEVEDVGFRIWSSRDSGGLGFRTWGLWFSV